MSPEALAGWILGVLDSSDDVPSPAQIRMIRQRLSSVLHIPEQDETARERDRPDPQAAADQVAAIRARSKVSIQKPRGKARDPAEIAGLPPVVAME